MSDEVIGKGSTTLDYLRIRHEWLGQLIDQGIAERDALKARVAVLSAALEEVGVGDFRGGWLEEADRLWQDRNCEPAIPNPMVWVCRVRELVRCMLKANEIARVQPQADET